MPTRHAADRSLQLLLTSSRFKSFQVMSVRILLGRDGVQAFRRLRTTAALARRRDVAVLPINGSIRLASEPVPSLSDATGELFLGAILGTVIQSTPGHKNSDSLFMPHKDAFGWTPVLLKRDHPPDLTRQNEGEVQQANTELSSKLIAGDWKRTVLSILTRFRHHDEMCLKVTKNRVNWTLCHQHLQDWETLWAFRTKIRTSVHSWKLTLKSTIMIPVINDNYDCFMSNMAASMYPFSVQCQHPDSERPLPRSS